MDQTLDEAIYNRYIAPTKRQRTGRVGLEFELPRSEEHTSELQSPS